MTTETVTFVDTEDLVSSMVEVLNNNVQPENTPSIYIDVEGDNLSRHGTISILQLHVPSAPANNRIFIIDVHTLGKASFETPSSGQQSGDDSATTTLRQILESPTITKVFFDVRHDSDALYNLFNIELAGVQDIQLMELASRDGWHPKIWVQGLARCIESYEIPLSDQERETWIRNKEIGKDLFVPEEEGGGGGSYAVFNERPLSEAMLSYCAGDVEILPKLWGHYNSMPTPEWWGRVRRCSMNRVAVAWIPWFVGKGRHMCLAPRGWKDIRD